MRKLIKSIVIVSVVLSLLAVPMLSTAQEAVGMTLAHLNVRSQPSTRGARLGQAPWGTELILEGRNESGTWVLGHTRDNSLRGWVSAEYLDMNVSIDSLPVLNDTVSRTGQTQNTSPQTNSAPPPATTSFTLSSGVIRNARAIFQRGQRLGNRANVFTMVGDSITSEQPFFRGFGLGEYNLGNYTYLQDTINFFSVPPRDGINNSFVNPSLASSPAFTSAAVLDIIWGDPNLCEPNEAPLLCEYRITKPSVAIIMLGSIDVQIIDVDDYRKYLTQVVDLTLDEGIIPVLTTFPNGASYFPEKSVAFNNVIRSLAASRVIPLIELREPIMQLPNNGVREDQYHLSQDGNWYGFTGDEQRVGITMRNFMTLQALDTLMREVLTR